MMDNAFENFFHDWVFNHQDKAVWGPKYWRRFGVDVRNSQLVFDSEEDQLLFLLRWA